MPMPMPHEQDRGIGMGEVVWSTTVVSLSLEETARSCRELATEKRERNASDIEYPSRA